MFSASIYLIDAFSDREETLCVAPGNVLVVPCCLTTIPMFFFSPAADRYLAYSNIVAEWLRAAKHKR